MNKSLISLLVVAMVAALCLIYYSSFRNEMSSLRMLQDFYENPWNNLGLKESWEDYKRKFNKSYDSIQKERAAFENWLTNLKSAQALSEQSTWQSGETPFSDLSEGDFQRIYLTAKVPEKVSIQSDAASLGPAAASVDWVKAGKVTSVKNQKTCGSCWAFASIAAIESLQLIQNKGTSDYSEQQLVSCTKGLVGLTGCNGGVPQYAMKWAVTNGITEESNFVYTNSDSDRSKCPNPKRASFSIAGVGTVAQGNLNELAKAVTYQPVAVTLDASKWSGYRGGIFGTNSADCSSDPNRVNHCVLVVGYTDQYWLIKNSWGTGWGENGYIKLARTGNTCSIASWAVYPKRVGVVSLVDTDNRCAGWAHHCGDNKYVIGKNFS